MIGPYQLNSVVAGDCRELLPSLPDESVGLVITSPPYNIGLKYDGYADKLPDDEFQKLNRLWLAETYRAAKEGARLYAVISDAMVYWLKDMGTAAGWTYSQKLTWCKPNFSGSAGRVSGDWNYMSEDILLFRKGKRTPMLNGEGNTHNWFIETVPQSNYRAGRIHPAQWPLNLCLKILSRTPGEPVLDPFCGSGSALVAAKILGRSFLGFDLVPAVAERARKRLAETNLRLEIPEYEQSELPADATLPA